MVLESPSTAKRVKIEGRFDRELSEVKKAPEDILNLSYKRNLVFKRLI